MVSTQHELYDKLIIHCCYRNESESLQIIRVARSISNVSSSYLKHTIERTVRPKQMIEFQAPIDALLEIHEALAMSSIYADSIPCSELRIAGDPKAKSERLLNASGAIVMANAA
jgi:hypothetical protein